MAYGLKNRGTPKDEARRRVTLACRCVNQDGQAVIEGEAAARSVVQTSGGAVI